MYSLGNFVDGSWQIGRGKSFVSLSPNTDEPIWEGHMSTPDDVDECIQCAKEAMTSWSRTTFDERVEYVHKFVEIVKENSISLANAISMEIGKPLWEATTEVSSVIGKLDLTVSAFKARCNEIIKEIPNGTSRTQFKPLGIVAVLGPFNFPCHMPNGHIMPALISGNVVIFKPSEKGAMSTELMMHYWEQAGLPSGVINMLHGDGSTGECLVSDDRINGVFFTGSYAVGEKIRKVCSTEKMCALEMGGNSPLIVWDSSDLDSVVIPTIQSAFITAGQRCSAARRLIVPNSAFGDRFLEKLVDITRRIIVGRYNDEVEPFMGPVRSSHMVDAIINEQNRLVDVGAKTLVKCERLPMSSCFVRPGIIDITKVKMRNDEEIIGPFLKLIRVNTFDEAINEANNTSYGLAAGIFTEDKSLYEIFNSRICAGIVNWNQQLTGASGWAPFGGIKKSGNYRPSGFFAVDYCNYAVASIELEKIPKVTNLPKGIKATNN